MSAVEPLSAYLLRTNGHPELSWPQIARAVGRLERLADAGGQLADAVRGVRPRGSLLGSLAAWDLIDQTNPTKERR